MYVYIVHHVCFIIGNHHKCFEHHESTSVITLVNSYEGILVIVLLVFL